MQRTILSPAQTAWLDATFRRNAELYGGFRMEDDAGDKPDDGEPDDKPDADDKGDDDKPLGEAGQRALEAERQERKKLKTELDQFKAALGTALGIKSEGDKGDDQADLLASVQDQIRDMQRSNTVLALANTHGITDKEDLDLLASAKDDEAMKRLAERLAPTEEEDKDDKSKGRPKPDRTQGGGSGGREDNSGVSHGRGLYQASRGKTS